LASTNIGESGILDIGSLVHDHGRHQKNERRTEMKRSMKILAMTVVMMVAGGPVSTWAQGSKQPNILVIWGDDIGVHNVSAYNHGVMGYRTPNIDRIAREGAMFTDAYAQQSCTAGRASFILGQHPFRTGLLTIGMPGSDHGIPDWSPTIADLLKPQGYTTGQFGKNHLGDRDKHLPTAHGFDEFFGNLYHLNAEEEPETYYYPKDAAFRKEFGPRGVIHSYANGKIEDTGPLTRKRMETIDEEIHAAAKKFIDGAVQQEKPFFVWRWRDRPVDGPAAGVAQLPRRLRDDHDRRRAGDGDDAVARLVAKRQVRRGAEALAAGSRSRAGRVA
jgi:arylsulfatase A-like enzyme